MGMMFRRNKLRRLEEEKKAEAKPEPKQTPKKRRKPQK